MEIESTYLSALDLTHRMLSAAENQQWDTLIELEQQRTKVIATIPPLSSAAVTFDPGLTRRVAKLITDIVHESDEVLEHVQVWQKHVKILLRLEKPAVI